MSNKFIYIPVEIKVRELTSRLLLSIKFLEKGLPVVIGRFIPPRQLSDIVEGEVHGIWKGVNINDDYLLADAVSSGHKVSIMDEEGFLVGDLDRYSNSRFSKNIVNNAEHIFFWGEAQYSNVTKKHPASKAKSYIVSNPRVDMWRNKGFGLYDEDVREIKNKYRKYVLIASNLAFYTNPDYLKHSLAGIKSEALDVKGIYEEQRKKAEKLFHEYMRLAGFISRNTDLSIIIRPHPADDKAFWDRGLKGIDKIFCVKDKDVAPWILGAEALIHNCCTTSAEALLLGCKVISYMPNKISLYVDDFINEVGVKCESPDEVVFALRGDNGLGEFDRGQSLIDQYAQTSLNSSEMIRDIISEGWDVANNMIVVNKFNKIKSILFDHMEFFLREIKTKYLVGEDERMVRQTLSSKFPRTQEDEIAGILEILKGHKEMSISIEKIAYNLFLIRSV